MICLFWLKKKVGCTKKVFLLIFFVQPFFSCHHQSFFFPFWLFCHLNLVKKKKKRQSWEKVHFNVPWWNSMQKLFFSKQGFGRLETFFIKKIERTHENLFFFKKLTAGQYRDRVVVHQAKQKNETICKIGKKISPENSQIH